MCSPRAQVCRHRRRGSPSECGDPSGALCKECESIPAGEFTDALVEASRKPGNFGDHFRRRRHAKRTPRTKLWRGRARLCRAALSSRRKSGSTESRPTECLLANLPGMLIPVPQRFLSCAVGPGSPSWSEAALVGTRCLEKGKAVNKERPHFSYPFYFYNMPVLTGRFEMPKLS